MAPFQLIVPRKRAPIWRAAHASKRWTTLCNRHLWPNLSMRETVRQYHRRSRRIKIGLPVRFNPAGSDHEFFEEIATTSNISREGLYFLTNREQYQEGMRLSVTLPYHSPRNLPNPHLR